MKTVISLATFFFTVTPLFALTTDEARHLLTRTGFGATPQEIASFSQDTWESAVDKILAGVRTDPSTPLPTWSTENAFPTKKEKFMTPKEKEALRKQREDRRQELKAWWYREMLTTSSPFTEHLTLFWHNHFTSGFDKGIPPVLMLRQNLTWRHKALGNFRDFLKAVIQDPAMMIYLDLQNNKKGHPNENFARELLELFTLGEGHYDEHDIQEGARALTGGSILRPEGTYKFYPFYFDSGKKTIFGKKGRWTADDLVDLILSKPQTAEWISAKLWREFISEQPDASEITRLATLFRDQHYELRPLLRALLLSPVFRDPKNRGVLTKSPVDLIVGSIHSFQIPIEDTQLLVQAGRSMGQDIFDPPNVKGWAGGESWITAQSMLQRRQFLAKGVRGQEMQMNDHMMNAKTPAMDLNQWLGGEGSFDEPLLRHRLEESLLAVNPLNSLPNKGGWPNWLRGVVLDPAYQLK